MCKKYWCLAWFDVGVEHNSVIGLRVIDHKAFSPIVVLVLAFRASRGEHIISVVVVVGIAIILWIFHVQEFGPTLGQWGYCDIIVFPVLRP